MKIVKRIVSFVLAILLFFISPLTVYATDKHPWEGSLGLQIYYNLDEIKEYIKQTQGFWVYYAHQVGAVLTHDFTSYMNNSDKFDELLDDEKIGLYKDDAGSIKGVYTSKEFMAQFKAILDEYIKTEQAKEENGGFYILPTTSISDVPADRFINAQQFRTFRNIIVEKGCLAVRTQYGQEEIRFVDPFSDPDHPIQLVADASSLSTWQERPHLPVSCFFFCANDWQKHSYQIRKFSESDKIYTSISDAVDYETSWNTSYQFSKSAYVNWDFENHGSISESFTLYSVTGEKVRVYVSELAAKNYGVGKRKIYLTENYYNYQPEELKVAVDDLEKSVDDLKKIIEDLLSKIKDDSTEKEIMDLLKQILDALRDQQGTGGGGSGGGGGGDVIVDVDLKETNGWLSKIFEKISQIYKKMDAAVEDAGSAALAKIQESLDEIIRQLKKIKHWSAVDTVIDGVDMIADWVDLIRGVLTDADEGVGSAVSGVADTLGESAGMLSSKFPFSIPWDIMLFVSLLASDPQVPYFEIPIDIDMDWIDISIHYDFVIDFSQFQWFSDLSRLVLAMTYAVGLLKLTFNIALLKKEE